MERLKSSCLSVALVVALVAAGDGSSEGQTLALAWSTPVTKATISWISIEQAEGRLQQEQKPILIDLYTTWCGWCKQMDRRTYSNKKVAAYLSDKFYTVKLDAETHATITWQGKTYAYDPQYRCNSLAVYLSHGQLEFPTTVIIAPGEAPQAIPGYMAPKDLEMLVKYFGEGVYKTRGFDEYQRDFHGSW